MEQRRPPSGDVTVAGRRVVLHLLVIIPKDVRELQRATISFGCFVFQVVFDLDRVLFKVVYKRCDGRMTPPTFGCFDESLTYIEQVINLWVEVFVDFAHFQFSKKSTRLRREGIQKTRRSEIRIQNHGRERAQRKPTLM